MILLSYSLDPVRVFFMVPFVAYGHSPKSLATPEVEMVKPEPCDHARCINVLASGVSRLHARVWGLI